MWTNKLWLLTVLMIPVVLAEDFDNCEPSEFQCKSFDCIPGTRRCDGTVNCADGSDEINCNTSCEPPNYQCANGTDCLDQRLVCDGTPNCPRGDDEANCKTDESTSSLDEEAVVNAMMSSSCATDEFKCNDGMCVSMDNVCDGVNHCFDESDETRGCLDGTTKCEGFKCRNKKCLKDIDWKCDGKDDCGDMSDESDCAFQCSVQHKKFLCVKENKCINITNVCDGYNDCTDGSDESVMCSTHNCNTVKCPGECYNLTTGPLCVCSVGLKYVNTTNTCEDINECDVYGICSQMCDNTRGSFQCQCVDQFTLNPDKRTCAPIKNNAILIYSTRKKIGGYFLGAKKEIVITKTPNTYGVTYDGDNIYWTNLNDGSESLYKIKFDGSEKEKIFTSGLSQPVDVALDWLTQNIYFTDIGNQSISVCSNNASFCTVVVQNAVPHSVALDAHQGMMYWSDWGRTPMIMRSSMDGTKVEKFVTENIDRPVSLCLDWPNHRLYWIDAGLRTLESIELDGKNRLNILKHEIKEPYGIAVFDNRIYWSERTSNFIQSCNKFTGKDLEVVVRDKLIQDIHIYYEGLYPKGNHGCESNPCSHLCLLNSNRSYTCACPEGMNLHIDQRTCYDTSKTYQLIMGINDKLVYLQPRLFGRMDMRPVNLRYIASQMTFNSLTGDVIIADNVKRRILTVNLEKKQQLTLVKTNIGQVSSLSFDYLSNNIYWSDIEYSVIEVYSINTGIRSTVKHFQKTASPMAIAAIPDSGYFFVALKTLTGGTQIQKMALNGLGEQYHLFSSNLGSRGFSFAVDLSEKFVYWADEQEGHIWKTNYDGTERTAFATGFDSPYDLVIAGDQIFWTSSTQSENLYFANKKIGGLSTKHFTMDSQYFKKSSRPQAYRSNLVSMTTVGPTKISNHPCQMYNGNCSQICISSGLYQYTCMCEPGMIFIDPMNQTCRNQDFDCEYQCESKKCYTAKQICDGVFDCPDRSDELDCNQPHLLNVQCSLFEFKCADKTACIDQEMRCDHHFDCLDRSDEAGCENYDHKTKCRHDQFACTNGICIDATSHCDTHKDCPDGSDETNCDRSCAKGLFRCNSGQCIAEGWKCDGNFDCIDRSDESGCENKTACRDSHFKCDNSKCVDETLKCDGHDDCGDSSDESGCAPVENKVKCNELDELNNPIQFLCNDGQTCLPIAARCNNRPDCPRGDDEFNCSICNQFQFHCDNNRCIHSRYHCDGNNDCGDASDEKHCNATEDYWKNANIKQKCSTEEYDCGNGMCISRKLLCDGVNNCGNHADESGHCSTPCSSKLCEQNCQKDPHGPYCYCEPGFELDNDGTHCNDIDECATNPCAQQCENNVGSFHCQCYKDYLLRNDKLSCRAIGSPYYLVYSTHNQIRRFTSNPKELSVLHTSNDSKIIGIAVDYHRDFLYFTKEYVEAVFQLNMATNELRHVSNLGKPDKIALDWITGNVYIVDYNNNYISQFDSPSSSIKVCNFDHEACSIVLRLQNHFFVADISVDPINRFIFYLTTVDTGISLHWEIYRSSLDGSRVEKMLHSTDLHIVSIAHDYNKQMLYFTDTNTKSVHALKYSLPKHSFKTIVNPDNAILAPISLEIFEDQAFILNLGSKYTAVCPLYGDAECTKEDLGAYNAEHIVIAQKAHQKIVANVCEDTQCSVICVQAGIGPKCLCYSGEQTVPGAKCDDKLNFGRNFTFQSSVPTGSRHSSKSGSSVGLILGLLAGAIAVIIGIVLYRQKFNQGKFNISMHFQNPQMKDLDSAQVKMINRPQIVSTGTRNEIVMGTNPPGTSPSLPAHTEQHKLFNVLRSSAEEIHHNSEDEANMYDDNPKSRLIL